MYDSISEFRSYLSKRMRDCVKAEYLFGKLSKQETIAKVEELLHMDDFQCSKTVRIATLPWHLPNYLQSEQSRFVAPVIIAGLSESFFEGKWQFGFGIDTQHFLRPISPGAVILICVIIRHVIDEWKSGSFTRQKFEAGANLNSN
jgi:hypothetical protein